MVLEHLGPMAALRWEVRAGLPKEVPSKLSLQESGIRRVQEGAGRGLEWGWCSRQKAQYVQVLRDRKELRGSHRIMSGDSGRRGGRMV